MITHNPEAAVIAARIVEMRDGRITAERAGRGEPQTN
jgi:ABC-type lipoprotein export system ATPase subunit